jgi:ferredoxin
MRGMEKAECAGGAADCQCQDIRPYPAQPLLNKTLGRRRGGLFKHFPFAPSPQPSSLLAQLIHPIMADAANKFPQNVEGKFFVDDQCIDCDLCRETAPANFTRDDDGGHSYVFKQPENDEEVRLCEEAKTGCPVEAIGDDG